MQLINCPSFSSFFVGLQMVGMTVDNKKGSAFRLVKTNRHQYLEHVFAFITDIEPTITVV